MTPPPAAGGTRDVLVVVYDGVRSLDVTGPVEVFTGAGLASGGTPYRVRTASPDGEALARDHPEIEVDPDPIYVRDGHGATSAGVTAGIDLALALVEEDLGRDIALTVARHLVVFRPRVPGGDGDDAGPVRGTRTPRTRPAVLEDTACGIEEISRASGYGTPEAMRRAFLRALGTPPSEYARRFRSAAVLD
ncbi:hypothetical protein GCM10009801_37050 [Streptomyces albiaxialis]|uniref:HTH araC/xylS-type domain-containing protein n=1 Tax=Streptomyces albiaxialis TaxID=329523 RepID=A0ABP5HMU1_9ACTN